MRARSLLVLAALLGLLAFMIGCGSKFDLPTERTIGREVPINGSYKMIKTWRDGMSGIQDILLTQGVGTQLFLLFNHGGTGPGSRGEVYEYYLSRPQRKGNSMQGGLFNPIALCAGGSGGLTDRVFVLDQGDTTIARTTFTLCNKCGPDSTPVQRRYVSNVALYPRVREYGLTGGETLSTFCDTSMAYVNGIAADNAGNVFVSGMAIVYTQSNSSQFLFVRSLVSRINKYSRGPRYPGFAPADPNMPGANWHRDTTYFHTQGSGVGYVNDPHGMAWSEVFPAGLYVADLGNNSGQKLSGADTTGFLRYDQDGDGRPILAPEDIAVDASGYVYVCDTGNRRVLRFNSAGSFVQRVDVEPDDTKPEGLPLLNPVGVSANDLDVYVADRGRNELIQYERRP